MTDGRKKRGGQHRCPRGRQTTYQAWRSRRCEQGDAVEVLASGCGMQKGLSTNQPHLGTWAGQRAQSARCGNDGACTTRREDPPAPLCSTTRLLGRCVPACITEVTTWLLFAPSLRLFRAVRRGVSGLAGPHRLTPEAARSEFRMADCILSGEGRMGERERGVFLVEEEGQVGRMRTPKARQPMGPMRSMVWRK